MTDWFRKATDALGDLAGAAGRQAEIIQLQAKLGSLDDDLDRAYVEAGKRAEELLLMRQIFDEEIKVIFERARVLKEQMMQVRAEIQALGQDKEPGADSDAGPS